MRARREGEREEMTEAQTWREEQTGQTTGRAEINEKRSKEREQRDIRRESRRVREENIEAKRFSLS